MLNDPDDEMVLEAAVNGQADLVATMDLRHLRAGLSQFGIQALRPGDALHTIRERKRRNRHEKE
jgi:predicted nucleic acid-binding protein